jgi:hypothetical protein
MVRKIKLLLLLGHGDEICKDLIIPGLDEDNNAWIGNFVPQSRPLSLKNRTINATK